MASLKSSDLSASSNEEIRVKNPDDKGMGHGSMGWLEKDPRKFFSAAATRNVGGIQEVLRKYLADEPSGTVLEIGSGSGQHVTAFAQMLPQLQFLPTEYPGHPNPRADPQDAERIIESIHTYTADISNILKPQLLDASALVESDIGQDPSLLAMIAINVIHISPPSVMEGIIAGAGAKLKVGGRIFLYGPFAVAGKIEGDGNIAFQEKLKELNPEFGLRDTSVVASFASNYGLKLVEDVYFSESNNHMLCFEKISDAAHNLHH